MPIPTGSPKFFMEILLPGIVGAALAYGILPDWARFQAGTAGIAAFTGIGLLLGALSFLLRQPLALLATGSLMPPTLSTVLTNSLQARTDRAISAMTGVALASQGPELPSPPLARRLVSSHLIYWLFPLEPGLRYRAYFPTEAANLMTGLALDLERFGMLHEYTQGNPRWMLDGPDAGIRLWYLADGRAREALNTAETGPVVAVSISILAFLAAAAYISLAIVGSAHSRVPWAEAAACLLIAYGTYRASVIETAAYVMAARAVLIPMSRGTLLERWQALCSSGESNESALGKG
jgi:hypothetical protein